MAATVWSYRSKQPHFLLAVFAVIAVLGVGVWVGREWLLLTAVKLWIVSDPIGPADLVAVFGGGIEDRPLAAAQYYVQGLVQKVLVSNGRHSPAETSEEVMSEVAATERILVNFGVPASAIETFGNGPQNTYQEVLALRAWAERSNARSIIVPTEFFSARRVRWMLHRAFNAGFTVRVIALEPPRFRRDAWWKDEQGVLALRNEIIKYVFYRLVY